VAVTKTVPIERIQEAYDKGLRDFGENRVQELLQKEPQLPQEIRWHMIGHLQLNKAKYVAPFITLVHGLDSVETATELGKRAQSLNRTIDVLVEVNISGEVAKHGIAADSVNAFVEEIRLISHIRPIGLMGVASLVLDAENVRPQFKKLGILRDEIQKTTPGFDQLSIGMSGDFEIAIEEGATIIRIGSALFGARG
jgi:pyridoxal phosphate enzyme (YggS family)